MLITRSINEVKTGIVAPRQTFSVAAFVAEAKHAAQLHAATRNCTFVVPPVDPTLLIHANRDLLLAALANLLQNAFKFSHKPGHVSLTTSATVDRVRFDVEDECGGLPPGKSDELFEPFEQRSADRSGVGLAICRKAAKANGGEIRVRNIPGKGCVFTLDLPRKPPPGGAD